MDTLEEVSEPCSSWSSFCTSNASGLTKDASAKEIGILRIRGNLATQDDGMDAKVKVKICCQAKLSLLLVSRGGEIWSVEYSCFVGNTKVPLVKKKAIHRQHSSGNHSQQNSGTTNQSANQTPNRPTSQTTPNYQAPQIFGWQGADYPLVVLSVLVVPVLVVLEVVGSWALAGDICLSMSGLL